jgi:hypothetical protein
MNYETLIRDNYRAARSCAQTLADRSGYDYGVEYNPQFNNYRVFALPRRENRQGYETRCEVVSPSDLLKCRPGHGPKVSP